MSDRVGKNQFYLGVDGGGTGCRARLEDETGNVLGQGLSGPATTRLGIDKAWESIARAFDAAISEAGLGAEELTRTHAGIGLAGIGRQGAIEALQAIQHPFSSIHFISDGKGACLGAHSGNDGAIVIAGTGSIGLGFVNGTDIRVGGYGFPISDEGSGAFLGLSAIQQALQAHDDRIERTPLLNEVMDRFNQTRWKLWRGWTKQQLRNMRLWHPWSCVMQTREMRRHVGSSRRLRATSIPLCVRFSKREHRASHCLADLRPH